MPVVARQTITTTRTTTSGGRFARIIPLWAVKLITAILGIIVLVLIFLQPKNMWSYHSRTFVIITLANGFLLGWSLPSVLNRFLPFHKVDVTLHTIIACFAVLSLIVCAVYLIDNSDYSRTEEYKIMLGIGICITVQAIICCMLACWICCGNYTIVET
uniref:Uncharacterized protein n=1 Tax=Ditylenchus dipsaci TaxID=166011 RepID=A0A915DBI5_9BILA